MPRFAARFVAVLHSLLGFLDPDSRYFDFVPVIRFENSALTDSLGFPLPDSRLVLTLVLLEAFQQLLC